jgi:hypothetical protein
MMQDDAKQSAQASKLIESLTPEAPGFVPLVALAEVVWVLSGCFELERPQVPLLWKRSCARKSQRKKTPEQELNVAAKALLPSARTACVTTGTVAPAEHGSSRRRTAPERGANDTACSSKAQAGTAGVKLRPADVRALERH